jgi:hypothetical protein
VSKHTPGPWAAKPPRIGAAITVYGADGEFPVATTCSNTSPATMQAHRDGTVAANARLIAAAPELLSVLKVAFARQYNPFEPDNQSALYHKMAGVIAKAEIGETE